MLITTSRSRSSIRHSYRDLLTGHRRDTVRSASERSRTSSLQCTISQVWAELISLRRCSPAGSKMYTKTDTQTTTSTGSAKNPAGGQMTDSGSFRLWTDISALQMIMLSSKRNSSWQAQKRRRLTPESSASSRIRSRRSSSTAAEYLSASTAFRSSTALTGMTA